jgi:hypothetical protein
MARDPLDIIEQRESGGKNVPNYKYGPGFTASGYYQMINPTWRRWAKDAGIDISQYPTAMSAPRELQRAVAEHGFKTEGFKPWEAVKHLRGQEAQYNSASATPPQRRPDGAPGPRDAPSVPVAPQQGMLASIYEPFQKLAAEQKEQRTEQQLAEAQALAAARPEPQPQAPAPMPAAPPIDFAALMLPRIRRGLLGNDSYGLLG